MKKTWAMQIEYSENGTPHDGDEGRACWEPGDRIEHTLRVIDAMSGVPVHETRSFSFTPNQADHARENARETAKRYAGRIQSAVMPVSS